MNLKDCHNLEDFRKYLSWIGGPLASDVPVTLWGVTQHWNFDLRQNFYKGGGTSPENILKKQKKVKLKPAQINKIKKIIKNPEDKNYLEKDNFTIYQVLAALKRNKW